MPGAPQRELGERRVSLLDPLACAGQPLLGEDLYQPRILREVAELAPCDRPRLHPVPRPRAVPLPHAVGIVAAAGLGDTAELLLERDDARVAERGGRAAWADLHASRLRARGDTVRGGGVATRVRCKTLQPVACRYGAQPRLWVSMATESTTEGESEGGNEIVWPEFFPRECPPDTAEDACGVVYRLLKQVPPLAEDFECHWNIFPGRRKKFEQDGQRCNSCGLSAYRNATAARNKGNQIPALRAHVLGVATIPEPGGKFAATPRPEDPHHCTWWPLPDRTATYMTAFRLVDAQGAA